MEYLPHNEPVSHFNCHFQDILSKLAFSGAINYCSLKNCKIRFSSRFSINKPVSVRDILLTFSYNSGLNLFIVSNFFNHIFYGWNFSEVKTSRNINCWPIETELLQLYFGKIHILWKNAAYQKFSLHLER